MKQFIAQEYTGPLTRDEIEYWILDTAVLEHQPLSFLLASNADELLNKTLRLGPREDLWQIFEAMLQRGDVELVEFAYSSARRKWRLAPFEKGKLGYRELPQNIQYRLTRRGGWRWEVASKPRWNEFARLVDFPYRKRNGVRAGEAFAASREAIEVYLRRNAHFKLYPASLHWKQVRPLPITYWKTLPQGYRATFMQIQVRYWSRDSSECGKLAVKTHGKWYTNPYFRLKSYHECRAVFRQYALPGEAQKWYN